MIAPITFRVTPLSSVTTPHKGSFQICETIIIIITVITIITATTINIIPPFISKQIRTFSLLFCTKHHACQMTYCISGEQHEPFYTFYFFHKSLSLGKVRHIPCPIPSYKKTRAVNCHDLRFRFQSHFLHLHVHF